MKACTLQRANGQDALLQHRGKSSEAARMYISEVGDVEGLDSPASPEMGPAEGTPILPLARWTQPLGRGMGPAPKPCSPPRLCSGCKKQMGSTCKPAALCPSVLEGEGEMGEEAAKGTCPRDPPAPHGFSTPSETMGAMWLFCLWCGAATAMKRGVW